MYIDVSPFAHEQIHNLCGYKGKRLKANGKSDRIGQFLGFEEEQEEFLAGLDFRLKEIVKTVPDIVNKIIFTFDCMDTKCFRHDIYDGYKDGRQTHQMAYDYGEFKKCYKEYMLFLKNAGFLTLEIDALEADDIIGELCDLSISDKQNAMILTPDSDLKQLLTSSEDCSIVMYDSNKKIIVTDKKFTVANLINSGWDNMGGILDNNISSDKVHSFFRNTTKIEPKQLLLSKIIAGDKSDNISSCMSYTRGASTFGITEKRMDAFWESYNGKTDDIMNWGFIQGNVIPSLNEIYIPFSVPA